MTTTSRHISLREWRTFCAAAENSSFREAAEKLHVTASAVSHQIKNLETELGKRLFERGSREISLTPDGELLYDDVRPLLRKLEEVSHRHGLSARNSLRISVQPFFASELFVPRLAKFRELHPGIDITVDTSDESSEKHPAAADVSIRVFTAPPPGLRSDTLFPLRLVPAGSPAFYDGIKLVGKRIVSEFPLVIHDSRPRAWKQWERSSGIAVPRDARVVRMDSMIAVVRAAERGLGAALVPVQLSDAWFGTSRLVPLFDHELVTKDTYYLVCGDSAADDENVKLLRNWVLREFGDLS